MINTLTDKITLREASQKDLMFLFDLANDAMCRASAFNDKQILLEEHIKWFQTKLRDKDNSKIFIVQNIGGIKIGQIRFDKIENKGYIDFSIDRKYRGLGLGKSILRNGTEKIIKVWKDISMIVGEVKPDNYSSQKSFTKAGFSRIIRDNKYTFIKVNPSKYYKKFIIDDILYGIALLENEDKLTKELFFDLYYDCFGKREHLDGNWYEWFYNKNPWGKCNNYGLFDIEKNKLIGTFGYSCIKYCLEGKDFNGKLGINGMVNKDYTGKGLYSKLIECTSRIESQDNSILFSFPHCSNKPSSKGHINAGWKLQQKNFFYSKELDKNDYQIEKEQTQVADLKDLKLKDEVRKEFNFLRTNDWLNWRFEGRPHKKYSYLKIDNKNFDSYMVLGYYEGKGIKRCQILDFRANNMNDFNTLLTSAESIAIYEKCDILDLMISDSSVYTVILKRLNLKKTEEYYEMLIYSNKQTNFKIEPLLGDFDCV